MVQFMNNKEELLIAVIEDKNLEAVQKLLRSGVNPNILYEPCIYSAIRNKNFRYSESVISL
ncbi:hypothetical protein [Rickettsia oklahomensis]|uniref:Ankyrin repeat protein n=1 Tax=Rickettsia oklahomensis TaxID=3141789 RepID=A0AAU7C069_9RICK